MVWGYRILIFRDFFPYVEGLQFIYLFAVLWLKPGVLNILRKYSEPYSQSHLVSFHFKTVLDGAGEVAQWFRSLAALAEGPI